MPNLFCWGLLFLLLCFATLLHGLIFLLLLARVFKVGDDFVVCRARIWWFLTSLRLMHDGALLRNLRCASAIEYLIGELIGEDGHLCF